MLSVTFDDINEAINFRVDKLSTDCKLVDELTVQYLNQRKRFR